MSDCTLGHALEPDGEGGVYCATCGITFLRSAPPLPAVDGQHAERLEREADSIAATGWMAGGASPEPALRAGAAAIRREAELEAALWDAGVEIGRLLMRVEKAEGALRYVLEESNDPRDTDTASNYFASLDAAPAADKEER